MQVHRLAQINYSIRAASFAASFLVVGLVLWDHAASVGLWIGTALLFLVYPHLAWLRAIKSSDPHGAEKQNMYVDAVLLGALLAGLGFPTWVLYGAVFSITLNSIIVRGPVGAAVSFVCFAAGALAWILPMGFMHYPNTSPLVTTLCFVGSVAYTCGVGSVVYRQRQRLRAARQTLAESE